jgi:glyoxylase-like metal-dependent hydrolase (beta-lactamase superfamily II)
METVMIAKRQCLAAVALAAVAVTSVSAAPAQDMADVTIETTEVAPGIYMLTGRGGNIGLSTGSDGAFMIDDQFAPLTPKILAAVGRVTDEPVRFLVNTHWHGDHTGGNENMGKAGAIIVSHVNVRERMSREQHMEAFNRTVPASPEGALPVVTFTDAVTFHWNGDDLHVFHVAHAHTDGDAIIHFRRSNVVHMGDTFFNGMYPFIDVGSGGSIDGLISAVERVMKICDDDTALIPGHGPLAGVEALRTYHRMLVTVRDRVHRMVLEGRSDDEIVAAKPTRDFDPTWGGGFIEPDQFVGLVLGGMQRPAP